MSDELELLMGFPAGHTHVPLDPDGKTSVKLSEDSRHRLLANSWHVPCLRVFAMCILFSCGVRSDASQCAAAGFYEPWEGYSGDLPGPDVLKVLHNKFGQDFVISYLSCLDDRIANVVRPYLQLFDAPGACGDLWHEYRAGLGHDTAGAWQPDLLEAECRAAFQAAANLQTGFHLKRGAVPRIVPHGLEPADHWLAATSVVETPLDQLPPLALSSRFAVDTVSEHGPATDGMRRTVIQQFRRKAKQLARLNVELQALMPAHVRHVAHQSDVAFFAVPHGTHCMARPRIPEPPRVRVPADRRP